MAPLVELDALEILVIVDNEVDPISTYQNPAIQATGNVVHIAMRSQAEIHDRGDATKELRMDNICCGAHGLSLMIVSHFTTLLEHCLTALAYPDRHQRRQATHGPFRHRPRGRRVGAQRQEIAAGHLVNRANSPLTLAPGSFR
jgi:hypothetical protein